MGSSSVSPYLYLNHETWLRESGTSRKEGSLLELPETKMAASPGPRDTSEALTEASSGHPVILVRTNAVIYTVFLLEGF